jgi:hypothetical protein
MVVLLVPIAQASPPLDQDLSGKYVCYGPWVILPDGEEAQAVYRDLSKKEAEAGLATGAYVECSNKILPYQAGS